MRAFRPLTLVRRVAGLILAVSGIAIVINSLPGFVWMLIIGIGLVWAGWLVFRAERIY